MPTFLEIAEANQLSPNPLSSQHLLRLAQMCGVHQGTRVLDLACGGGELLNQWAKAYDLRGTGVDESEHLINIAQSRANEMEVWSNVHFVVSDVLDYPQDFHQYNVVSWLGAGDGDSLAHRLGAMQVALRDNAVGLLLTGEIFWRKTPAPEICEQLGVEASALFDLSDLVEQFVACGTELRDMLLLSPEEWDVYYTQQWRSVMAWLHDNPEQEGALHLYEQLRASQKQYLKHEREYIGWGVFVLDSES